MTAEDGGGGDGRTTDSDVNVDSDPSPATVVQTAAEAAESVVFSRYDRGDVRDLDVTVDYEDGRLEVDVYLDAEGGNQDQVAEDAALAARGAADDLLL
jgi:hypothetical protein